jgi:hypothetical protein
MAPPEETAANLGDASLSGALTAARRVVPVVAWGVLPVLFTARTLFRLGAQHTPLAGDFHYAFWPAGQRLLHGVSPYVDPGARVISHAIAFVYPAVGALLLAPLALLPHSVADSAFALLNLAAILLTLRVLAVRDWRLYGLALLCPMVFSGWSLGNVTLLLGLGVAVAWRNRDRPLLVGSLIAVLVSIKLFLWPLALWLLATRRYAALSYATLVGLVLNAVAWTILGFNELHRYSQLMQALVRAEEQHGYSIISLALRAGTSRFAAYTLAILLVAGAAAACIKLGRAGRDLAALALSLAASILATPIVQLHYFALALVPFAVARPRLTRAWALPLAFWACWTPAHTWQVAVALALGGGMLLVILRHERSADGASLDLTGKRSLLPTEPAHRVVSRVAS